MGNPLQSSVPNLQLPPVLPAHLPSRAFHHSANPLYRSSSCLTLLDPGHLSSHVLQKSHICHCTASVELTTHLFFTSTIVTPNHKTSSSSCSSVCYPPDFPLETENPPLQTIFP